MPMPKQNNTEAMTVRISINDLYAYLFALNQKPPESFKEQQQVHEIEDLIRRNMARKDIPEYAMQQMIVLPVTEAQRIFGLKWKDFQILDRIRETLVRDINPLTEEGDTG